MVLGGQRTSSGWSWTLRDRDDTMRLVLGGVLLFNETSIPQCLTAAAFVAIPHASIPVPVVKEHLRSAVWGWALKK